MALTRRTPQLGELATAVEVELARRGFVDINTAAVDAALNAWVARGRPLCSGSISPRAALRYAPDELPGWIADELEMGESHEPDVAPRIDLMSRQTDLI